MKKAGGARGVMSARVIYHTMTANLAVYQAGKRRLSGITGAARPWTPRRPTNPAERDHAMLI